MKWMLTSMAALVLVTASAQAQGDGGPLVDALVKKGVLSSQEGEEIRASMLEDLNATGGGMLSWGSSAVKGVKLYGDARMRYQWENAQDSQNGTANPNNDRSRFRYRLRLGADYQFSENWKSGIRLETSESNDSTNNNFGGYFDKVGDEVYVGLVYLEYETNSPVLFGLDVADYFDLRMGKHLQPFLISSAWWDGDINPEGFSEQIAWNNIGTQGLDFTLRGGQYVISETDNRANSGNAVDPNSNEDAWLFVGQSEIKYSWAPKTYFAFAPTVMVETGGMLTDEENGGTSPAGENPDASLGDLAVLMIPMEAKWNMWNLEWKAYGTYGHNFAAGNEADNAVLAGDNSARGESDRHFWNAGLEAGKGKGKGAWKLGAEYRYIDAFSYSTNLSDSDFGKNLFNQRGVVVAGSYGFTENITGAVTWMHSSDIDSSLDVDNGTTGESDGNTVDVLQVDMSWKF